MIRRATVPKASGIYYIESASTGRQYVGSAVNLQTRKYHHFYDLNKKNHCNTYLQNHVNKYGVDDLKFVVVEFCPPGDLIEREQYHIDLLQPAFNICPIAYSQLGMQHTDAARKKMSETRTGHPLSKEHKKKISEGLTGHTYSKAAKRRMSEAAIGKILSEATKKKISERMKIWYQTEDGGKHRERLAQISLKEDRK